MGFKVASRVRGLSDEAFREAFGAEEQCRSALSRLRWPDGFVCPACGHRGHCVLAGRSLYQCNRCKKQTSSTAGTIFHATKLPLTLWFAAVHLIVTAKNGISSVELGRRLGVKQPTAWTMKHKIMAVMARREADTPLSGRVEMDDAYLGGARAGGKRGRGAPGKTPFVAAVSTSPEGRLRKVKLVPVKGFRKREIARGAKRWLAPGSEVLTDGLRCWNALDGVVGSHRAIRTGSGRQAARMAPFKWVNTTLGNIKSAITGTYRKARPRSCPTLPRQLRLAIQPALPAQHHDPALRSQRRTNPTHPIPSAHRWMTFMDKQEIKWSTVEEKGSVYEAVRCAWKVSLARAKRAEYVLAIVNGICKGVFAPDGWHETSEPDRYEFEGQKASGEISKMYLGKRIPDRMRKKGMAAPVLYEGY